MPLTATAGRLHAMMNNQTPPQKKRNCRVDHVESVLSISLCKCDSWNETPELYLQGFPGDLKGELQVTGTGW